jgi:hypothetical protein
LRYPLINIVLKKKNYLLNKKFPQVKAKKLIKCKITSKPLPVAAQVDTLNLKLIIK